MSKSKKRKDVYHDIPYQGSLGLFALGAVGILAWKKKRAEIDNTKATKFDVKKK